MPSSIVSFTTPTASNSPAKACVGPEQSNRERLDQTPQPVTKIHRPARLVIRAASIRAGGRHHSAIPGAIIPLHPGGFVGIGTPLASISIAECNRAPEGPFDTHTASFAALTGRALTIFRAGLALNIIGCPLKGFVPSRALVAGFLITTNLANPGSKKTPPFFSSL